MNESDLDDICEGCGWDSEAIIKRLADMVGDLQARVDKLNYQMHCIDDEWQDI